MDAYLEAAESVGVMSLNPGELADAAWAFAQLRFQPSEVWEQQAAKVATQQLPLFSPAQLGMLLWSWRAMQLPVPIEWQKHFEMGAQGVYPEKEIQTLLGRPASGPKTGRVFEATPAAAGRHGQ